MSVVYRTVDPLWQCLCPAWYRATPTVTRGITRAERTTLRQASPRLFNTSAQRHISGAHTSVALSSSSHGSPHKYSANSERIARPRRYAHSQIDSGYTRTNDQTLHGRSQRSSEDHDLAKPARARADGQETYSSRSWQDQRKEDDKIDVSGTENTAHTEADTTDKSIGGRTALLPFRPIRDQLPPRGLRTAQARLKDKPVPSLLAQLRIAACGGEVASTREIVEYLVGERQEKPSVIMYNSLIRSNTDSLNGAAWRVAEYLQEMQAQDLKPDNQTCHEVLKVLSIHPDHLLRADILEYMRANWFDLTEAGEYDIVAGLLRDGLFEMALSRLDDLRNKGVQIQNWLNDLVIYTLCDAAEFDEAYEMMRERYNAGHVHMSRNLWHYFLDLASQSRHYSSTLLVWNTQVAQGYLHPSSGTCLNALATAANAGDASLATEIFTHMSSRRMASTPNSYVMLMTAYLNGKNPDINRAITILTIMALENLEPTAAHTRALYLFLRDKPHLLESAFQTLQDLDAQGRNVPIAALNLLIECYAHNLDLPAATKIYKQIHTFQPSTTSRFSKETNLKPDIDTFAHLLRACRKVTPPNDEQAHFFISEMLALRIMPTAKVFDRVISVFLAKAQYIVQQLPQTNASDSVEEILRDGSSDVEAALSAHDAAISAAMSPEEIASQISYARRMLDWSLRHFNDMLRIDLAPRRRTAYALAAALAGMRDDRCWDVLQTAVDVKGPDDAAWMMPGAMTQRLETVWLDDNSLWRTLMLRDGSQRSSKSSAPFFQAEEDTVKCLSATA